VAALEFDRFDAQYLARDEAFPVGCENLAGQGAHAVRGKRSCFWDEACAQVSGDSVNQATE